MSHKRKDTLAVSKEWAKHLRPEGKRQVAKKCRQAGKVSENDIETDETPKGLGLSRNPLKMRELRKNGGEALIPSGSYCYGPSGNCPFWDKAENKEKQNNGYCWFLGVGDWDENGGVDLLWDQCKACGVRMEDPPEGTIEVIDEKEAVKTIDR